MPYDIIFDSPPPTHSPFLPSKSADRSLVMPGFFRIGMSWGWVGVALSPVDNETYISGQRKTQRIITCYDARFVVTLCAFVVKNLVGMI